MSSFAQDVVREAARAETEAFREEYELAKQEEQLEEQDAIYRARNGLLNYILYTKPTFEVNWHHRIMCRVLNMFVQKEIERLLVFAPPRNAKSEIVTRRLTSYILGRDPNHKLIAASYSMKLAKRMNRDVQSIMLGDRYKRLFPDTRLVEKGGQARKVEIEAGVWVRNSERFDVVGREGQMLVAGVGGGLTGEGADTASVDDPCKNMKEAQSETWRESIWDWWTSTLLTRLSTFGRVLLTMCMTGDTPVLMADGTWKPLFRIRIGDRIATYEDGQISTSKVKNWKCQGPDPVFRIKMQSGATVRANARHPFLVRNNEIEKWVKLKDLRPGDNILSVTGASGKTWCASRRDAKCHPDTTLDRIVEITEAGVEDVFDIQVERTENFIANGLVSHNTRWHEDDLGGRVLAQMKADSHADQYVILSFAAIKEGPPTEWDPRKEGEPLHASRFPLAWLEKKQISVGPKVWNGLFQQHPSPPEGNVVSRSDWRFYNVPPKKILFDYVCMSGDLNLKPKQTSDFTVFQVWGVKGARFYLLDQVRGRMGFVDKLIAFTALCAKWPEAIAKYIEDATDCQAVVEVVEEKIPGVIPVSVQGQSKESRADSIAPLIKAHNVILPHPSQAPWINDYIEEWANFPNGSNDDQVDATSLGLREIAADCIPAELSLGGLSKENFLDALNPMRR
jgi:predicted phage terminase large subunit-like protein